MQARPAYPLDAVTGGCIVTRRYEVAPDEQICDLDVDLDTLPAWGRLCVSELGVRMMANCLGLNIVEPGTLEALKGENDGLRAENTRMRRAFSEIAHAVNHAGIARYVDTLEAVS